MPGGNSQLGRKNRDPKRAGSVGLDRAPGRRSRPRSPMRARFGLKGAMQRLSGVIGSKK